MFVLLTLFMIYEKVKSQADPILIIQKCNFLLFTIFRLETIFASRVSPKHNYTSFLFIKIFFFRYVRFVACFDD